MAIDIQGALAAGYSQEEIAQELAGSNNFDLQGALKAGYSYDDILPHLAEGRPQSTQVRKEQPTLPQIWGGKMETSLVPSRFTPSGEDIANTVGNVAGRTLRAAAGGLAGTADVIAGPLRGIGNWARPGTFKPLGQGLHEEMDAAEIPGPENARQAFLDNLGGALAPAGASIKIGDWMAKGAAQMPNVMQRVGAILAENPKAQAVAALGGSTGQQAAQAAGAGPWGQFLAALAGGMAPAGVAAAARGAQGALGSLVDPAKLAAFRQAGFEPPSLGSVSNSGLVQRLEAGLEQDLFASPVMRRAQQRGQDGLTNAVEKAAERLSGGAEIPRDYESMGALAVNRAEASKEAFAKQAGKFEDSVYRPAEQLPARLENTLGLIDENAARLGGETGAGYRQGMIEDLGPVYRDAQPTYSLQGQPITQAEIAAQPFLAPMAQEVAPVLRVAALRDKAREVGSRMKAAPTADTKGVPQFNLGNLYGALKRDIDAALPESLRGQVGAYNKWVSQQKGLRQSVDDVFFKGKDNVSTAKSISTAEGAQLDRLRQVVGDEGFNQLRAAALDLMARDASGGVSAARLASSLGNGRQAVPQRAQELLFSGEAQNLRAVADALKSSSLFRNTSNTAGANDVLSLIRRFGSGGAGYALGGVPGIAVSGGMSNLLARGLTSPAQIARLGRWGTREGAPASQRLGAASVPAGLLGLMGRE